MISRSHKSLQHRAQRAAERSPWLLELAPSALELPAPIQKFDDPFLPYSRAVIAATADVCAGYVFDMAAYLTLGAAGAVALERAVALAVASDRLTVLHGPFTRGEFAEFASAHALRVDAATVTDATVADAFRARGVTALLPGAEGEDTFDFTAGRLRFADVRFRLIEAAFVRRFQREDFAEALRQAVAGLDR